MEPQVGEVLGRYRLDRLLGEGATSKVFLGTHLQLERQAAIKVLAPRLLFGNAAARLLKEARAVNTIRHPNIAEVFDVIESEAPPRLALVMEFVEGPSMKALGDFRFSFPQAIGVSLQLVAALSASHAAGIIHRDLKPDNLLFVRDPTVAPKDKVPALKVIDFGVAKQVGAGPETAAGTMLGTPAYMAPEQVVGNPPPSPATDVFAFGEILYELLTGKRAFPQATVREVIRAKLRGQRPEVELPAEVPRQVQPVLRSLIERCLEVVPGARPNLVELRDALMSSTAWPELATPDDAIHDEASFEIRSLVWAVSEPGIARAALEEADPALETEAAGPLDSSIPDFAPTVARPRPAIPAHDTDPAGYAPTMVRQEPRASDAAYTLVGDAPRMSEPDWAADTDDSSSQGSSLMDAARDAILETDVANSSVTLRPPESLDVTLKSSRDAPMVAMPPVPRAIPPAVVTAPLTMPTEGVSAALGSGSGSVPKVRSAPRSSVWMTVGVTIGALLLLLLGLYLLR
ncbi:MAG: protein kinase [Myxococcota bacterium]